MPSKKETIIPIKSAIEASKNPQKKIKKITPSPSPPPPVSVAVSKRKPIPSPVEEESEEEEEVHELFSESEEEEEDKPSKKAPKQYKPREKPLVKKERTARQIEEYKAA